MLEADKKMYINIQFNNCFIYFQNIIVPNSKCYKIQVKNCKDKIFFVGHASVFDSILLGSFWKLDSY